MHNCVKTYRTCKEQCQRGIGPYPCTHHIDVNGETFHVGNFSGEEPHANRIVCIWNDHNHLEFIPEVTLDEAINTWIHKFTPPVTPETIENCMRTLQKWCQ